MTVGPCEGCGKVCSAGRLFPARYLCAYCHADPKTTAAPRETGPLPSGRWEHFGVWACMALAVLWTAFVLWLASRYGR